MKKIYILRHCKSAWDNPGLADIDRPLNKRGKKDAPLMAEVMRRMEYIPDIVLSSPSVRTKLTIKPVVKALNIKKEQIFFEPTLYHGYAEDFEELITQQDDDHQSLLMVGHNPGITYIANSCIGESVYNVPTGGLLYIESDADKWEDFSFKSSKLVRFHYPKMYK